MDFLEGPTYVCASGRCSVSRLQQFGIVSEKLHMDFLGSRLRVCVWLVFCRTFPTIWNRFREAPHGFPWVPLTCVCVWLVFCKTFPRTWNPFREAPHRFQGDAAKPDTVMVDRGKGFYNIGTGNITTKFRQAPADHDLKNLMGNCAAVQPGHMQEILLHETAVGWIRHRLTTATPSQCWLETPTQYEKGLKGVVEDVNANLDVEGLCNNLLKRVDGVIESSGGQVKW